MWLYTWKIETHINPKELTLLEVWVQLQLTAYQILFYPMWDQTSIFPCRTTISIAHKGAKYQAWHLSFKLKRKRKKKKNNNCVFWQTHKNWKRLTEIINIAKFSIGWWERVCYYGLALSKNKTTPLYIFI